MKRFTAYRLLANELETHNEKQKNASHEPQYEGVIWTDGTVTIRWLTPLRSHAVWDNIESMLGVHGHPEYGTEIIWHDGQVPEEWQRLVAEWETKKELEKIVEGKDNE